MTVIKHGDLHHDSLPGRITADPLASVESESSVRIVSLVDGTRRTAHRHPHSEEVVIVVAGHGHVWVDGTAMAVGPGDVVRIPAGAAHATLPAPGVEMTLHCFFPHPRLSENIEETDIELDPEERT